MDRVDQVDRVDRVRWIPPRQDPGRGLRTAVGGFYLMMAGVHLGLVAVDPQVYETFADRSFLGFVRDAWRDVVMAAPTAWVLLLAAGEGLLGVLLLVGGRAARWGWGGVILFHLLLLPFGWWAWVWAVPALVCLVLVARYDVRTSHAH